MKKKYIIDLNPDCVEGEYLRIPARIAGEEQWLVTKAALTPYTEPDLEQVRKEGYKEGREAGIKDGKCEAWEAVRKIYDISPEDRLEIFPEASTFVVADICDRYSASECIEKIQAYEQEEIKVGDEVVFGNDEEIKAVVIDEADEAGVWLLLSENGCVERMDGVLFHRTGRHFSELTEIFKKMREE